MKLPILFWRPTLRLVLFDQRLVLFMFFLSHILMRHSFVRVCERDSTRFAFSYILLGNEYSWHLIIVATWISSIPPVFHTPFSVYKLEKCTNIPFLLLKKKKFSPVSKSTIRISGTTQFINWWMWWDIEKYNMN